MRGGLHKEAGLRLFVSLRNTNHVLSINIVNVKTRCNSENDLFAIETIRSSVMVVLSDTGVSKRSLNWHEASS